MFREDAQLNSRDVIEVELLFLPVSSETHSVNVVILRPPLIAGEPAGERLFHRADWNVEQSYGARVESTSLRRE